MKFTVNQPIFALPLVMAASTGYYIDGTKGMALGLSLCSLMLLIGFIYAMRPSPNGIG